MSTARGGALITGAGRRIGRTLALAVAQAGFDVAVHHRNSHADALATAAEIRAMGRSAHAVEADLAHEGETRALVEQAAEAIGPITLLINNASLFEDDRIETLTEQSWRGHMEVNLHAPILLAQAFAAALSPGRDGLIVNLLDQRVWNPNPQFFSYSLSKSALWAATQTLAQALAPRIRVNGVGPGPTLPSIHQSIEAFETEAANVPLERRATPEQVAAAVLYLVDATSVTGQMIAVDGGQHLSWRTPDVVLSDPDLS